MARAAQRAEPHAFIKINSYRKGPETARLEGTFSKQLNNNLKLIL